MASVSPPHPCNILFTHKADLSFCNIHVITYQNNDRLKNYTDMNQDCWDRLQLTPCNPELRNKRIKKMNNEWYEPAWAVLVTSRCEPVTNTTHSLVVICWSLCRPLSSHTFWLSLNVMFWRSWFHRYTVFKIKKSYFDVRDISIYVCTLTCERLYVSWAIDACTL